MVSECVAMKLRRIKASDGRFHALLCLVAEQRAESNSQRQTALPAAGFQT